MLYSTTIINYLVKKGKSEKNKKTQKNKQTKKKQK